MPTPLETAAVKIFTTEQLRSMQKEYAKPSIPGEDYDYDLVCMVREELERRAGVPSEVKLRRNMTAALDEAFAAERRKSEASGVMDTKGGE